LVGEQREIGRAWGEVSDSEKISGKFARVTEIYGVKKNLWRHLAAKREPLGGARKGEFVAGIEAYKIFDLKVADKQTNKQNSTLSDYKGRLKLSAREPTYIIHTCTIIHIYIHVSVGLTDLVLSRTPTRSR